MKRYRVVVGRRAEHQIQAIDDWWLANRSDASDLFLEELQVALRHLGEAPRVGAPYPVVRPRGVRRVLLRRSRYHVYYTVDDHRGEVRVRAVWHAARGGLPRLG